MKKTVILLMLLLAILPVVADDTIKVSQSEKMSVGIRLGGSASSMSYSNDRLSYPQSMIFDDMFGFFFNYDFDKKGYFAIRPEIAFLSRGGRVDDLDYQINARYVDFRVAAIFRTPAFTSLRLQPYLSIAPYVGGPYNGEIEMNSERLPVSSYNLSSLHYGLVGAVGVTVPIYSAKKKILNVGLEFGYNLGLSDTYSDKEKKGQSLIVNGGTLNEGTRTFRGMEISFNVSIPFSAFSKTLRKRVQPEPVEPVVLPKEEVVEVVEEAPIVVVEKKCYSLEEMLLLIDEKKDVEGKKICAIDGAINFETGKDLFDKKSEVYLDQIVLMLTKIPNMRVHIMGHTDNVGNESSNQDLSKRRALAVSKYILKKGIAKNRITNGGYGPSQPIESNETPEGRHLNRRVEFEISYR